VLPIAIIILDRPVRDAKARYGERMGALFGPVMIIYFAGARGAGRWSATLMRHPEIIVGASIRYGPCASFR
jgi:K+ transporter